MSLHRGALCGRWCLIVIRLHGWEEQHLLGKNKKFNHMGYQFRKCSYWWFWKTLTNNLFCQLGASNKDLLKKMTASACITIHMTALPWCCWSQWGTWWDDRCPFPSPQLVAVRIPELCRRSHQWTWLHHHPQLWPEKNPAQIINMHRCTCSHCNS